MLILMSERERRTEKCEPIRASQWSYQTKYYYWKQINDSRGPRRSLAAERSPFHSPLAVANARTYFRFVRACNNWICCTHISRTQYDLLVAMENLQMWIPFSLSIRPDNVHN